jgi:hypothetical protein
MFTRFVYLASLSPRRRDLLQQMGVPFQVVEVDVDESPLAAEKPDAYVSRLAAAKASAGLACDAAKGAGIAERRRCSAPIRPSSWMTRSSANPAIGGTPNACSGNCRAEPTEF